MRTESVLLLMRSFIFTLCQKHVKRQIDFQPGDMSPGSAGPPAEKHSLVMTAEPTASVLCSLALDVRVYDLT